MRRPTVPALTASNGHTTAVDHIAAPPQPYGGHVYVEEEDGKGHWVETKDLPATMLRQVDFDIEPDDRPLRRVKMRPIDETEDIGWETLDGHIVSEHIEFHAEPPAQLPQYVPPIGWVPVDPNERTPIYDQLNADCQHPRTPKGRISKKPPRLPWTGGVSYPVFIQGSRDDHSSYFGARR
jgi:hypothetical protein